MQSINQPVIKHGILSDTPLFAWESKEEYHALHQGLTDDYFPEGESERQLVRELTDILWRKRRLNEARKSNAAKKLHQIVDNSRCFEKTSTDYALALKNVPSMSDMGLKTKAMLKITEQEVSEELPPLIEIYEKLQNTVNDLTNIPDIEYQQVLETLPEEIKDEWEELVEYGERKPQNEALLSFLNFKVLPKFEIRLVLLNNHQAIKQQTFGEIYYHEAMSQLIRYEQFLDKKFEKTLSMLIKLKDLRPNLNGLRQKQQENSCVTN